LNFFSNQEVKIKKDKEEIFAYIKSADKMTVILAVPGNKSTFNPGDEIVFQITGKDAVYIFRSKVLKVELSADEHIYILKRPDRYERIQRREVARVSARMPIMVKPYNQDIPAMQGTVLDISGKGLRFSSDERLTADVLWEISFILDFGNKRERIKTTAQIAREIEKEGKYEYGAVFVGLLPSMQETITKFVFQKSLEERYIKAFQKNEKNSRTYLT